MRIIGMILVFIAISVLTNCVESTKVEKEIKYNSIDDRYTNDIKSDKNEIKNKTNNIDDTVEKMASDFMITFNRISYETKNSIDNISNATSAQVIVIELKDLSKIINRIYNSFENEYGDIIISESQLSRLNKLIENSTDNFINNIDKMNIIIEIKINEFPDDKDKILGAVNNFQKDISKIYETKKIDNNMEESAAREKFKKWFVKFKQKLIEIKEGMKNIDMNDKNQIRGYQLSALNELMSMLKEIEYLDNELTDDEKEITKKELEDVLNDALNELGLNED